jgi:hypothetical protein
MKLPDRSAAVNPLSEETGAWCAATGTMSGSEFNIPANDHLVGALLDGAAGAGLVTP